MGLFTWFGTKKEPMTYERMGNDHLYLRADMVSLTRLERTNCFAIANSLAEIWFPIDAIASRACSVPYVLVNSKDEEIEAKDNLKRLLTNPNPFSTLQQYIYDSVFFELATGNAINYMHLPDLYKGKKIDYTTIKSLWILNTDTTAIQLKSNKGSIFNANTEGDIVQYYMPVVDGFRHIIPPEYIYHERLQMIRDAITDVNAESPLMAVKKNVDNLLAVYSARFKIYENNGNAGVFYRQPLKDSELTTEAVNPLSREKMISDALNRNGITGNKNVIGFSSVPLGFINTLATIKDLEPFRETKENALQIAGVYQVDKDLVPTADGATFENKRIAEKALYQNTIIPMAEEKARVLTSMLGLEGMRIKADFSKVAILQDDEKTRQEGEMAKYDSYMKKIAYYDVLLEKGIITDAEYKEKLKVIENE